MAQLRAVGYDAPMDDSSSGAEIRDSVNQLVAAMRESSNQLATATESFALESMQAVNAAMTRSEQAAETTAALAQQAQSAVEEARGITESLKASAEETRKGLRDQQRSMEERLQNHDAQLDTKIAEFGRQLQERIDEAMERLETRLTEHKTAVESGIAAIDAAEAVAARVQDSVTEVTLAARSAQQAAEKAQQATEQSETYLSSALTAVATARQIAGAATASTGEAGDTDVGIAGTGELLGRLEDDYTRLTRLVQQLHERIDQLNNPSFSPSQPAAEPTSALLSDATPPDELLQAASLEEPGSAVAVPYDTETPSQPASATQEDADVPPAVVTEETATSTGQLQDRVQVKIAPVQNFDRLLSLDSALTSLTSVTNVTLGDYERDEVTFRVELAGSLTAAELARQIAEAAGLQVELIETSETSLIIRIE